MLRTESVALMLAAGLVVTACGDDSADGDSTGPRATTTVEFVYLAATSIDPAVQQAFPDCVSGVGQTHIHPGWRDFVRVNMAPVGAERWQIAFDDVPVDVSLRIRISDPNVCAQNPTGAATENVFANDVELTRIVETPGSGIEPGLGFSVSEDGTVTP